MQINFIAILTWWLKDRPLKQHFLAKNNGWILLMGGRGGTNLEKLVLAYLIHWWASDGQYCSCGAQHTCTLLSAIFLFRFSPPHLGANHPFHLKDMFPPQSHFLEHWFPWQWIRRSQNQKKKGSRGWPHHFCQHCVLWKPFHASAGTKSISRNV